MCTVSRSGAMISPGLLGSTLIALVALYAVALLARHWHEQRRRDRLSEDASDRVLRAMIADIAADRSWRPRAERVRWLQ